MSYQVKTTPRFNREFKRLDPYTQRMLKAWIEKHLVSCDNPGASGKALSADLRSLWRYRIGDYRILCELRDAELIILALSVGHRREVYRN